MKITTIMLQFTKMHGLGNDFMVVDGISQRVDISSARLKHMADRKFGIGFDQFLLVEPPTTKECAFKYRIFNADGTEVNQCGNGARCFAKFVIQKSLTDLNQFWVETNTGKIKLWVLDNGDVRANMGVPNFEPENIPLAVQTQSEEYELIEDKQRYQFSALEIGNPHAVFKVSSVKDAPVEILGSALQKNALFPEQVNVGFYEFLSENEINLRVFERGVGETRACGSGACAAVIAGFQAGLLTSKVKVNLLGGSLIIEYAGAGEPVFLVGSASTVYHGKLSMDYFSDIA